MGGRSKYILLAEDNPADVQLVREALEDRSVDCGLRVVPDGAQAIAFIEEIDGNSALPCPSLLLLDLHLPERNGEEILRRLRAGERCGQTPVVILTSSDAPSDVENATRHAALHYFRKPSDIDEYFKLGDIVKGIMDPGAAGSATRTAP